MRRGGGNGRRSSDVDSDEGNDDYASELIYLKPDNDVTSRI